MSAQPNLDDLLAALPLEALLAGYQLSQVLFALVRLRLPERLVADGPGTLAELARECAVEPRILEHLLEIARGLRLLERDEAGRYTLADAGRRLCPDAHDTLCPRLAHLEDGYAPWGALHLGLATGQVPFEAVHGTDIFSWLGHNPERNAGFNRFMEVTIGRWLADTGNHYPFAGHLVDLGGNTGALAARLLTQFPRLRATLVDLEQALAEAPALLAAAGVAGRCTVRTGSFFDAASIPTDGDLYLFSRVLLNWNDAKAAEILRTCRAAMPAGSRLLILEFVRPAAVAVGGLLGSLNLWVMFGARTRTREEFEALLAAAGFGEPRWIPLAPDLFLLEAHPG